MTQHAHNYQRSTDIRWFVNIGYTTIINDIWMMDDWIFTVTPINCHKQLKRDKPYRMSHILHMMFDEHEHIPKNTRKTRAVSSTQKSEEECSMHVTIDWWIGAPTWKYLKHIHFGWVSPSEATFWGDVSRPKWPVAAYGMSCSSDSWFKMGTPSLSVSYGTPKKMASQWMGFTRRFFTLLIGVKTQIYNW